MRRVSLVIGLALVVTACGNVAETVAEKAIEKAAEADGNGDVDVNLDENGGTISIQTDDGETSIDIGGGELPDGLTVPVMDGGTVVGSTSASGDGAFVSVSVEYPDGQLEDLVAFYEDYFSGTGDVIRQESSSDGVRTWTWVSTDYAVSVGISAVDGTDSVGVGITQTG